MQQLITANTEEELTEKVNSYLRIANARHVVLVGCGRYEALRQGQGGNLIFAHPECEQPQKKPIAVFWAVVDNGL